MSYQKKCEILYLKYIELMESVEKAIEDLRTDADKEYVAFFLELKKQKCSYKSEDYE